MKQTFGRIRASSHFGGAWCSQSRFLISSFYSLLSFILFPGWTRGARAARETGAAGTQGKSSSVWTTQCLTEEQPDNLHHCTQQVQKGQMHYWRQTFGKSTFVQNILCIYMHLLFLKSTTIFLYCHKVINSLSINRLTQLQCCCFYTLPAHWIIM